MIHVFRIVYSVMRRVLTLSIPVLPFTRKFSQYLHEAYPINVQYKTVLKRQVCDYSIC